MLCGCGDYMVLIHEFLRQYNGQKLDDTKAVIRSRKSKKDRQYNGQKLEDTKL
jgi:hypothetical protein